jgi:aspartate/methionine/tyrosine aminotransferase
LSYVRPGGGLFVFLDISSSGLEAEQFALRLLEQEHVAVVPGGGFGLAPFYDAQGQLSLRSSARARQHVRLSFAVQPERLRLAVDCIARFMQQQRKRGTAGSYQPTSA